MKITVNGKPLQEFLGREQSKDIHQVRQIETKKYWKDKPRYRYVESGGHSKVKVYEDWQVFVWYCDTCGLEIADLEVEELAFVWRNWKCWSGSKRLNKTLREIVLNNRHQFICDNFILRELFNQAKER